MPLLLKIIWAIIIVTGFACLYLLIEWQKTEDKSIAEFWNQFSDAFYTSLIVFSPLAAKHDYSNSLSSQLLWAVLNFLGFLYLAFAIAYLAILKRKARVLTPYLYQIENQVTVYPPLSFSAHFCKTFGLREQRFILEDWEAWAKELNFILRAYPALIYVRSWKGSSWLSSLNIVLEATAEIIVSDQQAINRQARAAFGAARQTLANFASRCDASNSPPLNCILGDEVLSAEIVFDEECDVAIEKIEMLKVWQLTYKDALNALSKHFVIAIR